MAITEDNYASKKIANDKDQIFDEESIFPSLCLIMAILLCFGIILLVLLMNIFGYKPIG